MGRTPAIPPLPGYEVHTGASAGWSRFRPELEVKIERNECPEHISSGTVGSWASFIVVDGKVYAGVDENSGIGFSSERPPFKMRYGGPGMTLGTGTKGSMSFKIRVGDFQWW